MSEKRDHLPEPSETPEQEIHRQLEQSAREPERFSEDWMRSAHDRLVERYLANPELTRSGSRNMLEALAKERAREIIEERRVAAEENRVAKARAMDRLKTKLRRFVTIGVLPFALGAGTGAAFTAYEHLRAAEKTEKAEKVPECDLTGLDGEATKERMQRLLTETYPRGWRGGIARITYKDEEGRALTDYGLPNQRAAATTEKLTTGGSAITFYRGTKGVEPRQNFGETLAHEIGHAEDWERDAEMTVPQRQELKRQVLARIGAPDRYKSGYVESINRPDKNEETELKTIEYWAEISRVYLASAHPDVDLVPADRTLVENRIRATDQKFDQRQARLERERIIGEMERAKFSRNLQAALERSTMPEQEKTELAVWAAFRWENRDAGNDELNQSFGRANVAKISSGWQGDENRHEIIRITIMDFGMREKLVENLAAGRIEEAASNLNFIKSIRTTLRALAAQTPQEAKDIEQALAAEFDGQGLRAGRTLRPGEYATLLDWQNDRPQWLIETARWQAAPEDAQLAAMFALGFCQPPAADKKK